MTGKSDIDVLRRLAETYASVASNPVQDEKRALWSCHNSLKESRVPILISFGPRNAWYNDFFSDERMDCQDEFYRCYERWFKQQLFHYEVGIDMLKRIPNLRQIAVTPVADIAKCVERIGEDYVLSWRPNPTDHISFGFDESKVEKLIKSGLEVCRGCHVHIHLKDVETVGNDPLRLRRWVAVVRRATDSIL